MRGISVFAFGIGIFMILTGFVSAECASNQIIMKLSTPNNAHGALWDYAGYTSNICYNGEDGLFAEPYSGTSPHDCNSDNGNVVLKLNNASNAHAASRESTSYAYKVCHKGLSECETVAKSAEGTLSCPAGKTKIAYLNSTNNSHVLTSPSGAGIVVCCKGASIPLEIEPVVTECLYLATKEECNLNSITVGPTDSGCNPSSGNKDSCYCTWNTTASKCMVEWGANWNGCGYKCVVESIPETDCVEDYQIIRLNARTVITSGSCTSIPVEVSGCRSGSATAYCGKGEVQLPFFGAWQLVTSLISIALVYVLLSRKNML